MSPKKKKMKTSTNTPKRQNECAGRPNKRAKSVKNHDEELQAKKRKNFITACEQVSYKAYFDHRARLLLLYLPPCMKNSACKHDDSKSVSFIPNMYLLRFLSYTYNLNLQPACVRLNCGLLTVTAFAKSVKVKKIIRLYSEFSYFNFSKKLNLNNKQMSCLLEFSKKQYLQYTL